MSHVPEWIALILLLTLSALLTGVVALLISRDRKKIWDIASILQAPVKFTVWRGWVVQTLHPRAAIWINRWEDPSTESPALLINVDHSVPFPVSFSITNRAGFLVGRPFLRPFSRDRGLKEVKTSCLPAGLHLFCRVQDRVRCEQALTPSASAVDRFAAWCQEGSDVYVWNLGSDRLRISMSLDAPPERAAGVFRTAVRLLQSVGAV